jgi:EAL domain-containing protein (putative c-di-GMP-specific phosphodiesterase class I)/CheY-like chemotaxis protein
MARAPSRILLVDDEPGVLGMLKTTLRRYGFETEEAVDGRAALVLVRKKSFDVIVSDVNMPNCPGLEFLRAVRERDLDVPVIMMTAKPTIETSARAVEFGAFRYLVKPVMPAELKEVIDRAVELHEIARAKRKALELHGISDKSLGAQGQLETIFASAMDSLYLVFQPIVTWRTRSIYGYEALVRSAEPAMSTPELLFDAAERLGKLREIGLSIRRQAATAVPPDGAKLFVNLHAADLMDDDLYVKRSQLGPIADRVVLEITERASLHIVSDLPSRVRQLKRLGFQLAIDDLGAGYAGLSAFTQLEPDIVKLDISLVRSVHVDHKKQSIVRRLLEMCGDLRIAVVAEGVESIPERDTLIDFGCHMLQGFLFAKPATPFPPVNWSQQGRMNAS